MKTFEDFNTTDQEMEDYFLEIAHLDELDITFDFFENKNRIFYIYKYEFFWIFYNDKKYNKFVISYTKIWNLLERKFNLKPSQINKFMTNVIEKYFHLKNYTITI